MGRLPYTEIVMSLDLGPNVSALMEKVTNRLRHTPSSDPSQISDITIPIIEAFDLLSSDEKSTSFDLLLGLLWGTYGNLSRLGQAKQLPPADATNTWS